MTIVKGQYGYPTYAGSAAGQPTGTAKFKVEARNKNGTSYGDWYQLISAGTPNSSNPYSFTIKAPTPPDLKMHTITVTPSPVVAGMSFSANFIIGNYGGTDWKGQPHLWIIKNGVKTSLGALSAAPITIKAGGYSVPLKWSGSSAGLAIGNGNKFEIDVRDSKGSDYGPYYEVGDGWNGDVNPYTFTVVKSTSRTAYADNFNKVNAVDEINETSKSDLVLFPNPVQNELNISSREEIQSVVIYSSFGLPILNDSPRALRTTINTDKLASGIYIVLVTTASGTTSSKIVVEN